MTNIIPLSKRDDGSLTTQGAYPSPDDLKFVAKVQDWWQEADDACSNWLEVEQDEHNFAIGHQWQREDYEILKKTGRYPLVLNKTLSHVLVISGQERSNRMRVRYLPVEQGDTQRAETWTEVARIVQEQSDLDWNKSDAFYAMLKGGRGFVHLRMDYTENPQGDLVSDIVPPWELRIDPACTDYDPKNARYIIWSKDISLEELLLLWPEKGDELLAAQNAVVGKDDVVPVADRDSDYDSLLSQNYDKFSNKWRLREAWYWQVEKTGSFLVQNPQTGEWQTVMKEDEVKLMLLQNPEMQWKRESTYERKYYQAFVVGPLLLENNPSYLDYKGYPFVPFYGLYDDQEGRYVGITYHLKDPQIEINKRRTQTLHIINQAAKSGWYGPKGSFVDRDHWEKKSALPGFIGEYEVEPGYNPPQQIVPQTIPTAFVQMEQMAKADFHDISGVNIEMLGLGQKDTPGIVVSQRQRQAMTVLQIYFDNCRRSTKILGRLLLSMLQQFYTDGRQFTITGQQVTMGNEMKTGRYDLVVEEAPWSPNQKMETAYKIKEIVGLALQAGVPIPPDIIDYMDLPEVLTEKWKSMLEKTMQEKPPDPRLELEAKKLEISMRDQIRKEFEAHFNAILKVAQAEAAEAGTQMQQYQSYVAQYNAEQDRKMAMQQQMQQAQQQQAQQQMQQQAQMQKMMGPRGGPPPGMPPQGMGQIPGQEPPEMPEMMGPEQTLERG